MGSSVGVARSTDARPAQHPADGTARRWTRRRSARSTAGRPATAWTPALGCDIRIMAESAKLAAAFVKRGMVPEIRRHLVAAADDRLGQGIRIDLYRPHAVGARMPRLGACQRGGAGCGALGPGARGGARRSPANAPLAVQAAKRMMRHGSSTRAFSDHVHHVYLQLLPLFKTQDMHGGHQGLHGEARARNSRAAEPQRLALAYACGR